MRFSAMTVNALASTSSSMVNLLHGWPDVVQSLLEEEKQVEEEVEEEVEESVSNRTMKLEDVKG